MCLQRSSPSVFSKQIPELGLVRSGQGLSPVIYLDRLIQSKCSKRHDSVLAFYNLFNVEIRIRIKSYKEGDVYEMPPDKFLIQAMRAIIEVTQNLYILTVKARQLGPNIEELWQRDMPSWCPYFGTSFKSVSIPHANDISFDTTTRLSTFSMMARRSLTTRCCSLQGADRASSRHPAPTWVAYTFFVR